MSTYYYYSNTASCSPEFLIGSWGFGYKDNHITAILPPTTMLSSPSTTKITISTNTDQAYNFSLNIFVPSYTAQTSLLACLGTLHACENGSCWEKSINVAFVVNPNFAFGFLIEGDLWNALFSSKFFANTPSINVSVNDVSCVFPLTPINK